VRPTIQAGGTRSQLMTWEPRARAGAIVVTDADAGPGMPVTSDTGATAPVPGWVGAGLLVGGGLGLLAGVTRRVAAMSRSRDAVTSLPHPAVGVS
jgi:hypothetical protein